MHRRGNLISAILAMASLFILPQCAWMEVRKSQKAYLKHITPTEIQSESLAARTVVEKVMTAHVYVDRDYPRSAGWREHFKEIVDQSNEVLLKYLDLRIQIKEFREWDRRSNADNIDSVVDELAMAHSCNEADWIIGLVSPVTGVTSNFHTAGVARLLSCHFVIRGLDTSSELEALKGMFLVTDKEAQEVYDKRLRHKEMTLFLHELAHTLGALHTVASDTLLHPYYSQYSSGFSPANVELMKLGLRERGKKNRGAGAPTWASLWQAKIKEIGWNGWSPRSLKRFVNQEGTETKVESGSTTFTSEADLTSFKQALEAAKKKSWPNALEHLDPLLKPYQNSTTVQELACYIFSQQPLMYVASKRYCQKTLSLDPHNRQVKLWMVDAHVAAKAHKELRVLLNQLIVEMQQEPDTEQNDIRFLLVTSYKAGFKPEVLKLANMMPEDKQIQAIKRWARSK